MPQHESPFDIPNFEQVTTDRMAHYYIVAQKCHDKLQLRYLENPERMSQIWEARKEAWHANPENPSTFPSQKLTLEIVNDFYAKCDALCNREPVTTNANDLVRIYFAANNGAQFISSVLLDMHNHPLRYKISREAGRIAIEAFYTPAQIRAAESGRLGQDPSHTTPPPRISSGDVLHYTDGQIANKVRSVRLKDHGTSAMKGEFYIVTDILDEKQDDNRRDREVPVDEMERWLRRRVQAP